MQLSDESFSVKYAWFLSQLADLVVPFNELHLTRQSHRGDDFLNDVMHTLLALEGSELCAIVRVEFQDEIGRDAGGLQREWYLLAAEAIMTSGLFVLVNRDDQSYFINPHAATSPLPQVEAFEAVGRFIGRALLDGQGLSLPLNPVLFKAILGTPLTLDDVEMLDTQVFQSLRYVLEHDSVESLALTFAVTEDIGSGKLNVVELVEGGVDVEVTDANKHDYVQRMVHHLLFHRVERPLAALIQGVYAIIPRELLAPFDHKEVRFSLDLYIVVTLHLELILCGLPDIDVDDWKMHTNTTDAVRTSPLWTWFWEIVADLSLEDRAKFLQYTTGSPRVPVQGFSGLTSYDGRICHFSIRGVTYTQGKYPVVHTCFNRIDLPAYPSKAALEEAIAMLLLTDATGFTLN
ncbi:hypothetical protein AaE_011594 [Aphanomyces astaci]|uniref:HECT-type E3 ubiquitin transferase n=1 Tax=Aphanomyces astaci TaxID=112090 RepID=A0A6A4ZQ63_APHAT|nr:hypothetical protein AaE_011594 [Aphanomyces astaci]